MGIKYPTVREMIEKKLRQETRPFWRVAYLSDVVVALVEGAKVVSGKFVNEDAWKVSRDLLLEIYDKLIQLAEAAGYSVEDGKSSIRLRGTAKVLVGTKVVEVPVDTEVPTPFGSVDAGPWDLSYRTEGELLDRIAKIADFFFWSTEKIIHEHREDLLRAVGIEPQKLRSLAEKAA